MAIGPMLRTEDLSQLRVAIPHYWLMSWRGGEKVVRALLDLFPQADIYTLFYDNACSDNIAGHNVYTSILDVPILRKYYQRIFPLYPVGVRSLRLRRKYDLILSSESGPIKGIQNPTNIPHLCYIHTPPRYCWGYTNEYLRVVPKALRGVAAHEFERLRRYDESTISGVHSFIANSFNVKRRVQEFYKRNADVVYPPISLELFNQGSLTTLSAQDRGYYLCFSALTPYKRVDLAVEAVNRLGRKLIVIGDGGERHTLQVMAGSNVTFTGVLPYPEVQKYIRGAKALIFPGEEDFGMIPLEVMAHGVPVIAYRKGGAVETVIDISAELSPPPTGLFFDRQSVDAVEEAIVRFEKLQDCFVAEEIQLHARKFGEDHFKHEMSRKILAFLSGPTVGQT